MRAYWNRVADAIQEASRQGTAPRLTEALEREAMSALLEENRRP